MGLHSASGSGHRVRPRIERLETLALPATLELAGGGTIAVYTADTDEYNVLSVSEVTFVGGSELVFQDSNSVIIWPGAGVQGGGVAGFAAWIPNPVVTQIQIYLHDERDFLDMSASINTYVDGGDGDDVLETWSGNDTVLGFGGGDWLTGNGGDDNVWGGGDYDVLYGGTGQDTLDGGGANDELHGGWNADSLNGGLGSDFLYGESGTDILYGGPDTAVDRLWGGEHADTFIWTWEDVFEDFDIWEDTVG